MNKNRLEAFSDGVFAIIITLLILGIDIPDVGQSGLNHALVQLIPNILAFILSFIIVGMYWTAHHTRMQFVEEVDRNALWLNLLTLLVVAFIPFPTALLGEYPDALTPVILYGLVLCLENISGILFWWYVTHTKRLVSKNLSTHFIKRVYFFHSFPIVFYLIAIGLSFVNVLITYIIYCLVPLFFILPNPILKKSLDNANIHYDA